MNQNYKEHHEPLIRIKKRTDLPVWKAWMIRIFSIVLALLIGAVIFSCLGYNPIEVYAAMIDGCFGRPLYVRQTIKIAIPLLGAAIAIAPAFRMKFWNIGAEGQITMGALFATYFALFYYDKLPHTTLLIVMFFAAMVGGALWAVIPAVFKAKWGTNETLFTLMLNYIAIGIVKYLQGGPGEQYPKGTQQIRMFDKAARLPDLLDVNVGWVIVLALVVFMFVYLKYTKHGYEISVVGESERTARYAGMNVFKIIVRTMLLSGAIAGIVGFILVSGINYTLSDTTANGVGFTAITVAWLAKLNSFGMIIITALLAVLDKGASTIQTRFGIPETAAEMLTGMILFGMLGSEFFIRFRMIFRKGGSKTDKGSKTEEPAEPTVIERVAEQKGKEEQKA